MGPKHQGKVRDYYLHKGRRILITTDRISAFDRVLGFIPYKGQVLNQLSSFWFSKTADIVDNHLISIPHPNVAIVKDAKPYPVEMVVRGYITGVTTTSIWYSYEKGERVIYGIKFPQGLRKNQKLKTPIITPTTKAEHGLHDERLTHEEILKKKLISPTVLKQMEKAALALYERGNKICNKRGLILVDTKYEFGEYKGKLVLIDEIHTPDSSRYWKAENYRQRFEKGMEPENFDKEFFRIWYTTHGYRGDGKPPEMPVDLQIKTAVRYIKIYEMITGKKFKPGKYPLEEGIRKALKK
ncbi:phosphoribosylaminoimidazolesuccinocarboxamide synthase [Candidatus Gottesmanbacteria bacterium RIFCSPLOWO2_01_FULL_39_12b]|uniref:Phosphoribosylaminoimidazole-succinocarboxamide synthase n=1 Tax=Candidatus Gottesmanbacteria bacterium RIFCSPLOWO2_01_FULL_39_12b TaxID=1798388 RepID=A0A1F6AR04_9BACT|nr:MAG: phosphoribosylaminoimidazolesuccinocarboxamide synthase [Candidatus Gottesmanbacteria bacterium RIFCSPLOWO2_01_FULL_39_12b]